MSPHEAVPALVIDGKRYPGDFTLRCPCGARDLPRDWHVKACGPMDGQGHCQHLISRTWRTLYVDEAAGREFCSALCALRWNDYFARAFAAHTGAESRPVVSGWWFRPTPDGDNHAP
jgi:hypothetical protein